MRGVRGSRGICVVEDCGRPHRRNGLCDMHDGRKKRTGTTEAPARQTPEGRFWAKVIRRAPNECWPWTAAVNEHGYGVFNPDGRHSGSTIKAHRFALSIAGVDVTSRVVRHSCDNRKCVNPAHLSLGTPADNSSDMVSRERQARGSRNGRGKLTEQQVAEIRTRAASGELHRILAADYGVSRPTISRVVTRKGWRHVPDTTPEPALAA